MKQIRMTQTEWEQSAPYSKMLASYTQAAQRVQDRRSELKQQLREMLGCKQGTHASARAQMILEQRIAALRDEYADLSDAMRAIRRYAEQEVRS